MLTVHACSLALSLCSPYTLSPRRSLSLLSSRLFVSFSYILHTHCSYPFPPVTVQYLFSLCRLWLYDTANGICNFTCVKKTCMCVCHHFSVVLVWSFVCVCVRRGWNEGFQHSAIKKWCHLTMRRFCGPNLLLLFLCVRFSCVPCGCASLLHMALFPFVVQRNSA